MTDVIIDRTKKTIWIKTENADHTYTCIDDNVRNSGNWYVIDIERDGVQGEIILPCNRTNMITFGNYDSKTL
jgi:hypothetical protein